MKPLPEDTTVAAAPWDRLVRQAEGLLADCDDNVANAANFAALLYHELESVNWVGFYFLRGDTLVLGPFQGLPACTHIALGEGVCGTAAARREVLRVDDVHRFPGHIACDTASNSEVVVPLIRDGKVLGVLDVDSPEHARFSPADADGLARLARAWLDASQ